MSVFLFFSSSSFCCFVHFCLFIPPLCATLSSLLSCQSSFRLSVFFLPPHTDNFSALSQCSSCLFFYMSGTRSSHTHTHVHHSSCISRSLCDLSLRVHTDSPLRCSQILAVALASYRAPGRAAQRKHTRAPAHASARAHTHKDEHGHAQLRRSTLGGHKYRAVHMHTLEQGGVGE